MSVPHFLLFRQANLLAQSEETHLDFLLDKKEFRAKFVTIFLRVVGWVERDSANNRRSRRSFRVPTLPERVKI